MGSGNAVRESISQEPNEMILAAFRDVGLTLAEARKEQNLTIKQVADQIYIRQRYLEDLEVGDFSDLPGRVYIFGFIRTYARLLNLDGEELIRRVSTLPNYQRGQSPIPMPSEEEPNFPILIVSAALIFLIVMGGYFFLKPTTKVSPPAIINETIVDDSKPERAQESAVNSFSKEDSKEDVSEAEQLELPKEAPSQIQLNAIPSNDKSSTETPAESITSESITKEEIPNALFQKKITLKASEPSWIEIRDEAGRILFMKVLKSGEEYVVPEKPGITMNTGNAGGLDIFVGDTKLPTLGAHGDVKRGIRLETLQ